MVFTGVVRKALGVGAVAATALLVLVAPASAHTPQVKAACADGKTTLTVKLTKYNATDDNTVKVVHGQEVLVDEVFETEYTNSWQFDGDVKHEFEVTVDAWDDPDGKKGFSFTKSLEVEACVTPPTTTTTTPPPPTTTEQTTTEETTTSQETTAPETPPAATPPAASGGLANTGASIFVALTLGVLMLAGGAALLLLMRRRDSAR